jgi:hypothetical protein
MAGVQKGLVGTFWLHRLKHEVDGALALIAELRQRKKELKGDKATTVQKTIGYMENHLELMKYGLFVKHSLPIGSGVIEASARRW